MGAVSSDLERLVDALGAAVDWLDEAYEEARQTLIDGVVAGAVLLQAWRSSRTSTAAG